MKGEKRTEDLKKHKLNFLPDTEGKDISDLGDLLRSKDVGIDELIKTQTKKIHTEVANKLWQIHNADIFKNHSGPINAGKTNNRESFTFSPLAFRYCFDHDESFRKMILSGAYIYYKGRVCLLHKDAFEFDGTNLVYSEKALANPKKYFLSRVCYDVATIKPSDANEFGSIIVSSVIRKRDYSHADLFSSLKDFFDAGGFGHTTIILNLVREYMHNGGDDDSNDSFCRKFSYFMKKKGFDSEKLAERTGIDKRTIERMASSENYNPSVTSIVACSLVMRLLPWESGALLFLAGRVLRRSNMTESIYFVMLQCFFWKGDLSYCDQILEAAHCKSISATIESHKKKNEPKKA